MVLYKKKNNPRLPNYDYSSDGYYFLTNNTDFSKPYLVGNIKDIVKQELLDLEQRFSGLSVFYYSLMRNHIHVILGLKDCRTTIPEIWRVFKSKSTVVCRQAGFKAKRLWQLNYFEHVIRNERALVRIIKYIRGNPYKEQLPVDEIYGDRIPRLEFDW